MRQCRYSSPTRLQRESRCTSLRSTARNRNGNRGQDHERREVRRDWSETGPGTNPPGYREALHGLPWAHGTLRSIDGKPTAAADVWAAAKAGCQPPAADTRDLGQRVRQAVEPPGVHGPTEPGRRYSVPPVS